MAPKKPGCPPAKPKAKAAATTAAAPAAPVRRSQRQTTKITKAAGEEAAEAPARVVKKAAPKKTAAAKKATPAKTAATKVASRKAAVKKPSAKTTARPEPEDDGSEGEIAVAKRKADFTKAFAPSTASGPVSRPAKAAASKTATKKSAAVKKTAVKAGGSTAPASPRRGRPRKSTDAGSAGSGASATSGISKATRVNKKKPTTKKPEVTAPDDNEGWTDSPKKTSPKKRQAKVSTKSAATVDKVLEAQEEEHRIGGKRRAPSVGGVRKSIEPLGPATTGKRRAKSPSKSPSRGISKSPARKGPKTNKGTLARSGSVQSIAGSVRTRSQSPGKRSKPERSSSWAAREADRFLEDVSEDLSDAARVRLTRQRSRSPTKSARKNGKTRGRKSKSPSKPASRNASRSPSASAVPKPLRVPKTRSQSSRSSLKGKSASPRRNQHDGSPERDVDSEGSIGKSTRSRASSQVGSIRSRASSVVPREFHALLEGDDDYGETLRRIEADAYKCTKNGREMMDRDELVSEEDQYRAQKVGIRRAETEATIRNLDSFRPTMEPPKGPQHRKTRRSPSRSPFRGKPKRRGSDFQPPEDDNDDDDDDVYPGNAPLRQLTPIRRGRANSNSAYQPPQDGDDDIDDIDPGNEGSGRSGSTRKRRANSKTAHQPGGDEVSEDEDFDDLARTARQTVSPRMSPAKKGRTTKSATKPRKRSPATVRRQGGWLGNKSRPSLVGAGLSTPAGSQAAVKKGLLSAKKGASTVKKTARSQSAQQHPSSPERDPNALLPRDQPSAPGRGTVRSVTNPEIIPGTNQKNPLFETMPGPEIWHRNMPPVFPYGETPFIQREMSRQIAEDLAGGGNANDAANESSGYLDQIGSALKSVGSSISNAFTPSMWRSPARQRPPAWELPEVSEAEVEEVVREMNGTQRSASGAYSGRKRKATTEARSVSPQKRARTRSTGGRRSA